MEFNGMVRKPVDSVVWQDYRASNTGMVIMYASDPVSEIPIREVPEEMPSEVLPEPNYETGTYGFHACAKTKIRSAFVKLRSRYLFFATKYGGRREESRDKYYITGFYRIVKTADVIKLHFRYLSDCACMNAESCTALRADEVHFVALDDAFPLTDNVLESWGQKSRITQQTRVILDAEQTAKLRDFLLAKPNALKTYVDETKRLQPHSMDEKEDGEEEAEESSEA